MRKYQKYLRRKTWAAYFWLAMAHSVPNQSGVPDEYGLTGTH
jgi:hypothetical protein